MKTLLSFSVFACIVLLFSVGLGQVDAAAAPSPRSRLLFDEGWKFHRGDAPGAEKPDFNDRSWRTLDLPHDWAIEPADETPATAAATAPPSALPTPVKGKKKKSEVPPDAKQEGVFDPKCPSTHDGGYLPGGVGWYRKSFTLPEASEGKHVWIEFDGVYMDSDVWLNGEHLGKRPYGYSSFAHDLTPHLKFGQPNLLAVRVNVQQPCSRWYSGAGIYRHVWLTTTSPVHVAHWGTYITTPNVAKESATVQIRTRVENASNRAEKVRLRTALISDDQEKRAATDEAEVTIEPKADKIVEQELKLAAPRLWSTDSPALYTALSEVEADGKLVDDVRTPFGIRSFEFTMDRGFLLNGQPVPIKGVCQHHDQGPLGAAAYDRAIQRQLEILKSMGCNAIRTSHNPPAPQLLDLCDQLGMLVMDEAFDEWKQAKKPYGYARFFDEWSERDLTDLLHRDRNHPSVVLWSIGNEIPDMNSEAGAAIAKRLAAICHREDPSRPVTAGCNTPDKKAKSGAAGELDVMGINYSPAYYNTGKGKHKLVASETSSTVSTRGEYNLVRDDRLLKIEPTLGNQCTAYDLVFPPWAVQVEEQFLKLKAAPWVAGEFVWTGFDYWGEPTPFQWPSVASYFGIVDLCGFPKDRYYLYQSQWTKEPMVHILPHWSWPGFEGKLIPVWCYTNADSVELFLNGNSLGEKRTSGLKLTWDVPYAPGTLKAIARRGAAAVASDEVHTARPPARLEANVDRQRIRADGQDLAYVTVRVLDAQGRLCPNADNLVRFELDGPGAIAGVGNGNPISHEDFIADHRKAFHGLCLAVVKNRMQPGAIRLKATSEGLESSPVTVIECELDKGFGVPVPMRPR